MPTPSPTPKLDGLERLFFLVGAIAGFMNLVRGPAVNQPQRIFRLACVAGALLGLLIVFILKRVVRSRARREQSGPSSSPGE